MPYNLLWTFNITSITWKSAEENTKTYRYDYEYDDLYRLKSGIFRSKTNSAAWTLANGAYNSEKNLVYDYNGNIKSLQRTDNNGVLSDNLGYEYNGNKIVAVNDLNQSDLGYFKNGTEKKSITGLPEYEYDQNGNLVLDKNKGITVEYNFNNLPVLITFNSGERIEWLYTSSGQKIRKNVYSQNGNLVSKTDYVGGMEFENEVLTFISNDEGRIRPLVGTVTEFKYEYDIKDHLGNVRMTITPDDNVPKILQEDSYYPFGLKIAGMTTITGSENKYTYNGKELVDDFDLNWYHYGARYYDPTLGRWHSIDPADEFHSPYAYCGNNPINFYDPNGMWADPIQNGELRGWYGNNWNTRASTFGMVRKYSDGSPKNHSGFDIFAKKGTDTYACLTGKIIALGKQKDWGNYVVIKANICKEANGKQVTETKYFLYAHLSKILVQVGDEVKEGATIAKTGNSGNAGNDPKEFHLHFEVNMNWENPLKREDPQNYMSKEFMQKEPNKENQTGN